MGDRVLEAFEGLLFGSDKSDDLTRQHSVSTAGSNHSVSTAEDTEKESVYVTGEKNHVDISAKKPPPQAAREDQPSAPPKWSDLLRSPTLYSQSPAVEQLWKVHSGSEARWEPGFFQIRPLAGLLSLLVAVCCVFASLAVLKVSDGQPVSSWTVQPTVYLAVVAAVGHTALLVARAQAVPVSWWYHASRGGSVRALQRHWEVNQSLLRALWHSRHPSLLHIACFATTFAIIDGPLLQRASTVVPAQVASNVTLDLVLPPELPPGFSGYYEQHILWNSPLSAQLGFNWLYDTPMHMRVPKCNGLCHTTVLAPALGKINCKNTSWPITPQMTRSMNATWGDWKGMALDVDNNTVARLPAFYVELGKNVYYEEATIGRELAYTKIGLISWFDLAGEYTESVCNYTSAIGDYDVILDGKTISLSGDADQGRVVRLANNTKPANMNLVNIKQPAALDAITFFLEPVVNANATVALNNVSVPGGIYSPDPSTYNLEALKHINWTNGELDLNFVDPTPAVINKYNQNLLRAAVMSATTKNISSLMDSGVSIHQTVHAQQTLLQNVYRSELRWYAAAAVFELFTVVLVLPMFWGFWTLGRHLTLSPFEVALAFDSPLLNDVNSAAGAKGVVQQLGGMELRFGTVSNDESADADSGTTNGTASGVAGRLGVAQRTNVVRPRRGNEYQL